jgi:2-polyprenyl-3-methyl-5-hydroxy-6-metoxy-1,4-benzoquinol methylase
MAARQSMRSESDSIRAEYERHGAQQFYERSGGQYRNPHEPAIERVLRAAVTKWSPDSGRVLDLACGSGEVTLVMRSLGAGTVHGIDPFTADAYRERTGAEAERLTFEEIAAGALASRRYSLIVCSFALHLVEPSRLPTLAYQLSRVAGSLLILTPHKRPVLKPEWGWQMVGEIVIERVRARYYRSTEPSDPA